MVEKKEREPIACAICGALFVPRHGNCKVCGPACRDERQRKQAKAWKDAHSPLAQRKQERQTVSDVEQYIRQHHKRTGDRLSYGKAVAKMAREGWRT